MSLIFTHQGLIWIQLAIKVEYLFHYCLLNYVTLKRRHLDTYNGAPTLQKTCVVTFVAILLTETYSFKNSTVSEIIFKNVKGCCFF